MSGDELLRHNQAVMEAAIARRDEVEARHASRLAGASPYDPLGELVARLQALIGAALEIDALEMEAAKIERSRFDADLTLKFPGLLARGGPKVFITDYQDRIVSALESSNDPALASIRAVGMYVNVTLSDDFLIDGARGVAAAGTGFGTSRGMAGERVVVDYSSPNVAKPLHAGHVRSTIIGDVLANILEAAGALVFRVNHINDFGGFGFLLEGHRRYQDRLQTKDLNQGSVMLYLFRRALERATTAGLGRAELPESDQRLLEDLEPNAQTPDELAEVFDEFSVAADARLAALERGCADEVSLWADLVRASMADFAEFYSSLSVDIDFVLGESLYAQIGLTLVDDWRRDGRALRYGQAELDEDIARLTALHNEGEISESELEAYRNAAEKDLGGVVVRLSPQERYVVLRGDGRTIYSTRDLAAVLVRGELFSPTRTIYVVGQEQRVHFSRLFAAAFQLGLADSSVSSFAHLYFGFYVDPVTHKKLSSRQSAAGITSLFETTRRHFGERQDERYHNAEPDEDVPHELTVASIVFNDLKQDVRSSVEIDTNDTDSVVNRFERAGGAYVVYSACRAGSVVRKAKASVDTHAARSEPLDALEVSLILDVLQFPRIIDQAAASYEPSAVVRYLLDLSNAYNSYYGASRVVTSDSVYVNRVVTTKAVERVLRNGLAHCNVDCPTSI